MFPSFPYKIFGFALLALGVFGLGYGVVQHYNGIVEANRMLSANNAKLELAIAKQSGTIAAQGQALEEWDETRRLFEQQLQEMANVRREAREELNTLVQLFSTQELEQQLQDDPDQAAATATGLVNRMFGLLAEATGGDCHPDSACRNSPGGNP